MAQNDRLRAVEAASPAAWRPIGCFRAPEADPSWVFDPATLSLVSEGVDHKDLVLVVAPGGAGKSTLVAAALSDREAPVGWVNFDKWDDDPAAVAELVVLALSHANPELAPATTSLVAATNRPAPRELLGMLVNELTVADTRVVVVLDDLHRITDEHALELVRFLIERSGPVLSVAATARRQPRVGLERLRTTGRMVEISDRELRFDAARASELLNDRLGLGLSPVDVDRLVDASAGWAIALRTATRSDRIERLPADFGPYIAEEVLAAEPPDIRVFLRNVAVLKDIEPAAVVGVTGDPSGPTQLSALADRLPFLIARRDDSLVFHELLRTRLLLELCGDSQAWISAHRRAAAVTVGNERVEHLLQAGDLDNAAAAMVALLQPRIAGPLPTERIEDWAQRIGPEVRAARPWVDLLVAVGLGQRGRYRDSIHLLEQVVDRCGDDYALRFLAIRHMQIATRDNRRFGPLLADLGGDERFGELPAVIRADTLIASAWGAFWQGREDRAKVLVESATRVVRSEHDPTAAASLALHYAAPLTTWPGGLDQYLEYHRWADAAFGDQQPEVRASCHIAHRWGVANRACAAPGIPDMVHAELIEQLGYFRNSDAILDVVEARLGGDEAAADRRFSSLWARLDRRNAIDLEVAVPAATTWASILRELRHHQRIADLLAELEALAALPDAQRASLFGVIAVVRAQWAWATGDPEVAEPLLRQAGEAPANPLLVSSRAELAALLHENGRTRAAVEVLEPLLGAASRSGTPARAAMSGRAIRPVLHEVDDRDRPFAAQVLALLAVDGGMSRGAVAIPGTTEQLSPREMEVLQVLATGATNAEVGERLFVSENTVKTHVKRILAKLGARSRLEAVAIARHHRFV